MKRFALAMSLAFGVSSAALADTCPSNPEISAELDTLFSQLKTATSDMNARPISNAIWELWLLAPDPNAQRMLDEGIGRLRVSDHDGAEAVFGRLITYCPDYAEGYNQRAFSQFLRGEYEGALADLDAAIERQPRHVGALSGRALTLLGMGENAAGQLALREALELNPWLSERSLLDAPMGEDI